MISVVVVAAGESDRRLGELLGSGEALTVLYAQTTAASFAGEGPDIVFVQQKEPSKVACRQAVLVARRGGALPEELDCEKVVAVVDSSHAQALEQAARLRLPTLTCGLSGSDTFTLSSLTADSAVVSLQRAVTAFDGSIVEPFELPVTLGSQVDPFSLLACTAVFCLMGARNPLAGRKLWPVPAREPEGDAGSGNRF